MRRCEFCKQPLEFKVYGGVLETATQFADRKFCNPSCAAASRNGITQKLHLADMASIYAERKGRKAPSFPSVVDEVNAEIAHIRELAGRRG